jgi:predicted DNA-binding transcriptional regulator AlpA
MSTIPTSEPAAQAALANFDSLPNTAYVRASVVAAWRGVSTVTVWRWAKAGHLPKPVKIGPNTTAWQVGALREMQSAEVPA